MISFISHALSPPAGRGNETAGQDESVEEGWTENVSRTHDYQLIFVVNIYVLLILILLWDTCYLDHKRTEKVLWLGCLHNLGCHNRSADSVPCAIKDTKSIGIMKLFCCAREDLGCACISNASHQCNYSMKCCYCSSLLL